MKIEYAFIYKLWVLGHKTQQKLELRSFPYGEIRVWDISPIVKLGFEIIPYGKIRVWDHSLW